MMSLSNSRTVMLPRFLFASWSLLVLSCTPRLVLARSPQSPGGSPAQQQPPQDATKKDSAHTPPVPVASKTKDDKPHRVFTNDDLAPSSGAPIAPGAQRRLKKLNRCDRACFVDVEKQALGWGYSTTFPGSTRQEMEDRLANDIVDLQNDPKWQRLLLEMVSAHFDYCSTRQKTPPPDEAPPHTPTRAELLEEEQRSRNPRPASPSNWNTASSAVLAYRFNTRPDPLKASLMVYYYMDELHQQCPVPQPADNADDSEDP
jgi:hypothetical protein